MDAVNAYQRANGLPVDTYLNMATVRALGVDGGE
jgi:peptidoglycan hydrolase-like protein with peptidoglycan-binding domain